MDEKDSLGRWTYRLWYSLATSQDGDWLMAKPLWSTGLTYNEWLLVFNEMPSSLPKYYQYVHRAFVDSWLRG